MHKELRALVKELESRNFSVERKGNHFKIRSEDGKTLFALPSTPGRGRWKQNLISELKRRDIL